MPAQNAVYHPYFNLNGLCIQESKIDTEQKDEAPTIAKATSRTASKPLPKKDETIEAWENNKDFLVWVASEPHLGEIDLRPYFFASKEKEDFFFQQVRSDQLRVLISKLMSGTMNIASINPEIKALAPEDAKKVFDIVSSKILRSADISTAPKGIDGR